MTTVAVLADPPRSDVVLPNLVTSSPLSGTDVVDLYTALLCDTVLAAERSGGELLVNYRPGDALGIDVDSEAEIRSVLDGVVDADSVRFEVQVGETFAGRVGNTATHLLETEGVGSVGITYPEAALLARTDIDGAAMKLRSSPVVLGPAPGGRVTYAAFSEPIDYADSYAPPALETLTDRALDSGLDVDFLETKPYLRTATDLAELVVQVRTRAKAGAIVPPHLASWIADSDLGVTAEADGSLKLRR
ncbi:MAG: hypothetical protein ACQET5_15920 [Halobacteriota archaeon]|uniref:hypothetical protein n=1 Tax=Natronomonas sp. TaxID=2184060 RepID=UPI003975AB4B